MQHGSHEIFVFAALHTRTLGIQISAHAKLVVVFSDRAQVYEVTPRVSVGPFVCVGYNTTTMRISQFCSDLSSTLSMFVQCRASLSSTNETLEIPWLMFNDEAIYSSAVHTPPCLSSSRMFGVKQLSVRSLPTPPFSFVTRRTRSREHHHLPTTKRKSHS